MKSAHAIVVCALSVVVATFSRAALADISYDPTGDRIAVTGLSMIQALRALVHLSALHRRITQYS